jgi:hypothetical protein
VNTMAVDVDGLVSNKNELDVLFLIVVDNR